MNSKAYRAVSSAQSKRYFARKKSWSGENSSQSEFLPQKTKLPFLQSISNKKSVTVKNPENTQV
ncbi:hypothetical protein MCEMIH22_00956 [Candidatus Methylacidiphilaceae bacterium]|jgi:hypothetical protein